MPKRNENIYTYKHLCTNGYSSIIHYSQKEETTYIHQLKTG